MPTETTEQVRAKLTAKVERLRAALEQERATPDRNACYARAIEDAIAAVEAALAESAGSGNSG